MIHTIVTDQYYADVIEWLQTNVGDLLCSQPCMWWSGVGWSMNQLGQTDHVRYMIRLADPQLAALCVLKWA